MREKTAKKPRKTTTFKALLAILALSALLAAGCSTEGTGGSKQEADNVTTEASTEGGWPVAEVARRIEPSVVQVNVSSIQTSPYGPREARGLGSGVIYREDGYIITNNHVVADADTVNVAFADGSVETGEVVGGDPYTDIAVVKVDKGNLPAAEFGDSRDLVVGQLAVAAGSPSGFQSTVTAGVISGLNREIPPEITGGLQQTSLVDLIQTDAAISPGSSGGALVDRNADVIGINVAYLPPAQTGAVNLGFAIPSATATDVADQIIEDGTAEHPYVGVSLVDLTPEIARRFGVSVESGAIITGVDPDGPASDAGIELGGVVTAVEGKEITSTGDLLAALRRYDPGERVEITVARDGNAREFTVELEEKR
jgi:serine protease Do